MGRIVFGANHLWGETSMGRKCPRGEKSINPLHLFNLIPADADCRHNNLELKLLKEKDVNYHSIIIFSVSTVNNAISDAILRVH